MLPKLTLLFLVVALASSSFVYPAPRQSSYTPTIQNYASSFHGFADSFKNELAQMISQVTSSNDPRASMLKDKILIGLISIDNVLKMIGNNKQREAELRPLIANTVNRFLSDMDLVQGQLKLLSNVKVTGNSNTYIGQNGIITGNNVDVRGNYNSVIGNNNQLVGNNAMISGNSNGVLGSNGVTVGSNNRVDASNSYVFSNNDYINRDNSLTIGGNTIDLNSLRRGGADYLIRGN